MIDKQTKFCDIKDNADIVSAVQEVVKVKKVNVNFDDDDTMEKIADKLSIDLMDLLLIANQKNKTENEFYQAYPQMRIKDKTDEPQWLNSKDMVDLDVRPSLSNGVDPFGMIMQTVAKLEGKILHIISNFETAPLYSVLGKQGFEHYSKEENGIWHMYFYKN